MRMFFYTFRLELVPELIPIDRIDELSSEHSIEYVKCPEKALAIIVSGPTVTQISASVHLIVHSMVRTSY